MLINLSVERFTTCFEFKQIGPSTNIQTFFLGYLKVSEIFRMETLGVFRNIHSLFTCPRVVLAISVLCQKQSNSAISHSKNVSHVSESAKTAIFQSNGTWKCLDLPQFRPLQENFEEFSPSDSTSVHSYGKN